MTQRFLYVFLAVNIHRMPLAKVEGTGVVKPAHVVHMIVSQQDGIEVIDTGTERLDAEVGSAVNKYGQAAVFHQG